jgi:hypothetical protein
MCIIHSWFEKKIDSLVIETDHTTIKMQIVFFFGFELLYLSSQSLIHFALLILSIFDRGEKYYIYKFVICWWSRRCKRYSNIFLSILISISHQFDLLLYLNQWIWNKIIVSFPLCCSFSSCIYYCSVYEVLNYLKK